MEHRFTCSLVNYVTAMIWSKRLFIQLSFFMWLIPHIRGFVGPRYEMFYPYDNVIVYFSVRRPLF